MTDREIKHFIDWLSKHFLDFENKSERSKTMIRYEIKGQLKSIRKKSKTNPTKG